MSNRLNARNPISLDQALAQYPSLGNVESHDRVGHRYKPIPTIDTLKALTGEGFEITQIQYARTRDITRRGFQKHLIRLRHPEHNWGAEYPEIVAVNSFDGSSSWQVWAGVYRFLCANGLVIGATWAKHTIVHRGGDITDRVVDATRGVMGTFDRVQERVGTYKAAMLTVDRQAEFAERAAAIRWPRGDAPLQSATLLHARREGDKGESVWNVYNRVQENVMKGGQSYRVRGPNGYRNTSMRAVNGIRDSVEINRQLSLLADEFAGVVA